MYKIGIDLGGTNIVAGVVNENNEIVAACRCKTACPRPADDIIADMAKVAKEAMGKAGLSIEDIAGVGVGSPGVCNRDTGVVERAENLGFVNVPLCDKLEKLMGVKVFLENDANAAALGEYVAGAAKDANSCVCITLGTGVGGGIIVDGEIYSGFNFAGAELGHIVIDAEGEPCTCGRNGCWEAYASATALVRQTKRAMDSDPNSKMWQIVSKNGKVDGRTAFDGMRAGDETARKVVDQYIRYIAIGLINMVNIFQPEVLCVGGGICKEGDTLILPLQKHIEAERFSKYSERQTRLTVAALGNDAGVIGAACLVK